MTHDDAINYSAKHPSGTIINETIATNLKKKISDGKISCASAHKIANDLSVPPADVGMTIDLLKFRIIKCQIGLFGYNPQKKIVQPAVNVSPLIEEDIRKCIKSNRITCLSCWEIAKKSGIPRLDVSAACETLKIKISSCQLGAF